MGQAPAGGQLVPCPGGLSLPQRPPLPQSGSSVAASAAQRDHIEETQVPSPAAHSLQWGREGHVSSCPCRGRGLRGPHRLAPVLVCNSALRAVGSCPGAWSCGSSREGGRAPPGLRSAGGSSSGHLPSHTSFPLRGASLGQEPVRGLTLGPPKTAPGTSMETGAFAG